MNSRSTQVHQKIKEDNYMKAKLLGLLKDEEGQGMTEYGLILALIAVVVIVALTTMGDQINAIFGKASGELEAIAPVTP